jgi:hypothetical protein
MIDEIAAPDEVWIKLGSTAATSTSSALRSRSLASPDPIRPGARYAVASRIRLRAGL